MADSTDPLTIAYRERAHLTALLAAQHPSHIHTDPDEPNWPVLTVELPTGQACWHIAAADMDLFAHVQPTPHYARGWDGHTTEEKYQRIGEFVRQLHPEAPTEPSQVDRIKVHNDELLADNERLRAELADANRAISELTGHDYEPSDPS